MCRHEQVKLAGLQMTLAQAGGMHRDKEGFSVFFKFGSLMGRGRVLNGEIMQPELGLKRPKFAFSGILKATENNNPSLIQKGLQSLRAHLGQGLTGAINRKLHA